MKTYEDVVSALETELEDDIAEIRMTEVPCICVLCGAPYETQPVLRVVFDGASEASFICPDRIACNARQELARSVVVDAVTLLPTDEDEPTDEELADECDRLAGELREAARDGSDDAPEGDE